MYKFVQQNSDAVTLHDCVAATVKHEDGDICIDLPDGIWLDKNNPHNPTGVTVRTGSAQVILKKAVITEVSVRRMFMFFGGIYTKLITDDPDKLIKNINCGKWEIEFLYEYLHLSNKLFICQLTDKRGKVYECSIEFSYTDIEYRWNGLCPDRKW